MFRRLVDRLAAWPAADLGLLALTTLVLVAAAERAVRRSPSPPRGDEALAEVPNWAAVPKPLPHLSDEASLATLLNDPFRPDRKVPPARYLLVDPEKQDPPTASRGHDRRVPDYRLKGIALAEATRLAVIEGSPARPGLHVYQLGDSIDFFLIMEITRDSVVLGAADTVIIAKMRRSWRE